MCELFLSQYRRDKLPTCGVTCARDKVPPSCAGHFVLFFLCSYTRDHAGSFFLAYLFSVLTHRDLFKQLKGRMKSQLV